MVRWYPLTSLCGVNENPFRLQFQVELHAKTALSSYRMARQVSYLDSDAFPSMVDMDAGEHSDDEEDAAAVSPSDVTSPRARRLCKLYVE